MLESIKASLPYLPAVYLPLFLVFLAPLRAYSGRWKIATVLAVGVGALLFLAHRQAAGVASLDVRGVFILGARSAFDLQNTVRMAPEIELRLIVMDRITAPGWQWPLTAAVILAVPTLAAFATWKLLRFVPSPLIFGSVATVWLVAARFALEKAAAPGGLVWAMAGTGWAPVVLVFFGVYSFHRQEKVPKFLLHVVLFALIQRAVISLASLIATLKGLGTHLDVGAIGRIHLPFVGLRVLENGPFDKWLWVTLVPQMTFWVLLMVVIGGVVGMFGYSLAKHDVIE